MAKRKKKRRAWTAGEVRELKTMARKKTTASQIAKKLKTDRRRDAPEGLQHRALARLPFLTFNSTSFRVRN